MIKFKSNYWKNENFQTEGRNLIENKKKNLKESNEKEKNERKGIGKRTKKNHK